MTKWTKKSIEKAYENGRRDFSGEDFSELDLHGITLSGAILKEATLTMTDMRRANLTDANLSGTNLTGADMRGANLIWTDMRGANLTGADIDYSCLPLWCGSLDVKVDKKIAVQLMYHACALDCDDPEYQKARAKVLDFANQMHRSDVERLN